MKTIRSIAAGVLALLMLATGCAREQAAFTLPENPAARPLTAPEKDFFAAAELLELNAIAPDDVGAVAMRVWFEDGSEGELLLTDRAAVEDVYQTFSESEIAWDIMRNTNPSTGEQLDMDWYLTDGTILRFYMRFDLGIEGIDDSFLFSSGASQDDYMALYHKYRARQKENSD